MERLVAFILLISTANLSRADVVLSSDTTITEADSFHHVRVCDTPPDHTAVTMTGGKAEDLVLQDASSFEQFGGTVLGLSAMRSSTATIRGGSAVAIAGADAATINIYAGEIAFYVKAADQSTATICGGTINADLLAANQGTINLLGGTIEGWLRATDSGIINVYGTNFEYDPTGAPDGLPLLTGQWLDGTQFALPFYGDGSYNHVNLLPEPSSIALLGLAVVLLRRLTRR